MKLLLAPQTVCQAAVPNNEKFAWVQHADYVPKNRKGGSGEIDVVFVRFCRDFFRASGYEDIHCRTALLGESSAKINFFQLHCNPTVLNSLFAGGRFGQWFAETTSN
jgi:hypothetical protein